MKNLILKSLILFIIVFVPYLHISNAQYIDKETSTGNTFSAASLDFELRDTSNNLIINPFVDEEKLKKDESVEKQVKVVKSGSLPFYYWPEFKFKSGEEDVCSALTLKAEADGIDVYDGLLSDFNLATQSAQITGNEDTWRFKLVNENSDTTLQGQACVFDINFFAYQNSSFTGFSDVEKLSNEVTIALEPTISMVHDVINHQLLINLGNLIHFQSFDFALDYDTATISDHADDSVTLSGESTKTIGIDLGIESDGVLVPHVNPHNFKLNIEFTNLDSETISYLEEL